MLAEILGKSLIRRTYENALQCPTLDDLIVATDEQSILDHVHDFGGKALLTSLDHLTGTDRAVEVVDKYCPDAEIVVLIQGDEPCLSPAVITQLVADLQSNPQADLTTAVEKISSVEELHLPGVVKCVFDINQKALYFSRSPIPAIFKKKVDLDVNPCYRHIGVYCYRRKFLLSYPQLPSSNLQLMEDLEQLKIIESGHSIYVSIVPKLGVVAVDYPEDIKKVESYLCQCSANIYS